MNRWANNYYTQPPGKAHTPSKPRSHLPAPGPPYSHSRSFGKTGGNGIVNLCVFRVAHLTQLTLKSFIESQGVKVLDMEEVSHKGAGYRSFRVAVRERDAPKLLSRNFWPGLVACRLMQDMDPWHKDVFSRRHPRELPFSAGNSENTTPLPGLVVSRARAAPAGHVLLDKPRTVHPVAARPHAPQSTSERNGKTHYKANANSKKNSERRKDEKSNSRQKENIPIGAKNSFAEKRPQTTTHKRKRSARVTAKIKTIRVRQVKTHEHGAKSHVANNNTQGRTHLTAHSSIGTKNPHSRNPSVGKNRKPTPVSGSDSTNSKNKGVTKDGGLQPKKSSLTSVPPPSQRTRLTVNKKYKKVDGAIVRQGGKHSVSKAQAPPPQSHWITPLRGLLSVSSEEALDVLLGPAFDRLLIQYDITDEEVFLGVQVLAHCARAKDRSRKLRHLVYKICQPQVVSLLKEFTRNVKEKHKARTERYFWDLGEFLDLYIVHNVFIQGMLSLFTTCLSKILSLSYKKYVSEDLVRVYRGMQTKVFMNLP